MKQMGFKMCLMMTLLSTSSALRFKSTDTPEEKPLAMPEKRQTMFCTAFVLNTGGSFDLIEKQFSKCDDYAFLSTYDDPERKIFKVLEKAPPKSQKNWPIAEAMVAFLQDKADKFDWFVKIDGDTVFRPTQMRAVLDRYSPAENVAVARPGRNSYMKLVGAAYALSGLMIKTLETKHLDAAKLAKGTWHSEDTVMNSWVPHAGGEIKNAINAHDGCTAFASVDRQELPTNDDIAALLAGKSYTKNASKDKLGLGQICYSTDLAAIHPVKDPQVMASLLKQLDP